MMLVRGRDGELLQARMERSKRFHSPNPWGKLQEEERRQNVLAQYHNTLLRSEYPQMATSEEPLYYLLQREERRGRVTELQQALIAQVKQRLGKLASLLKQQRDLADVVSTARMAQLTERYVELYEVEEWRLGYLPGVYFGRDYVEGDVFVRDVDPFTVLVRMTPYSEVGSLFRMLREMDDETQQMGRVFFTYQYPFKYAYQEEPEQTPIKAYSTPLPVPQELLLRTQHKDLNPAYTMLTGGVRPMHRWGLQRVWGFSRTRGSHVLGTRWSCCNLPLENEGCWRTYTGDKEITPYSFTLPSELWREVRFDNAAKVATGFTRTQGSGWVNDAFYEAQHLRIVRTSEELRPALGEAVVAWLQEVMEGRDEGGAEWQTLKQGGPYLKLDRGSQMLVKTLCRLIHEYNAVQQQPITLNTEGEWAHHSKHMLFNGGAADQLMADGAFDALLSVAHPSGRGEAQQLLFVTADRAGVDAYREGLRAMNNPEWEIGDDAYRLLGRLATSLGFKEIYETDIRVDAQELYQRTQDERYRKEDAIGEFRAAFERAENQYAEFFDVKKEAVMAFNQRLREYSAGTPFSREFQRGDTPKTDEMRVLRNDVLQEARDAKQAVDDLAELQQRQITGNVLGVDLFDERTQNLTMERFDAFYRQVNESEALQEGRIFGDAFEKLKTFIDVLDKVKSIPEVANTAQQDQKELQDLWNENIRSVYLKQEYERKHPTRKDAFTVLQEGGLPADGLVTAITEAWKKKLRELYVSKGIGAPLKEVKQEILFEKLRNTPYLEGYGVGPPDVATYDVLLRRYEAVDRLYERLEEARAKIKAENKNKRKGDRIPVPPEIMGMDDGQKAANFKERKVDYADFNAALKSAFKLEALKREEDEPTPWAKLNAALQTDKEVYSEDWYETVKEHVEGAEKAAGIVRKSLQIKANNLNELVQEMGGREDLQTALPTLHAAFQRAFTKVEKSQEYPFAEVEDVAQLWTQVKSEGERYKAQKGAAKGYLKAKRALEKGDLVPRAIATFNQDPNNSAEAFEPVVRAFQRLFAAHDTLEGTKDAAERAFRIQDAPQPSSLNSWDQVVDDEMWGRITKSARYTGKKLEMPPPLSLDETRVLELVRNNAILRGLYADGSEGMGAVYKNVLDHETAIRQFTAYLPTFITEYEKDVRSDAPTHVGFREALARADAAREARPPASSVRNLLADAEGSLEAGRQRRQKAAITKKQREDDKETIKELKCTKSWNGFMIALNDASTALNSNSAKDKVGRMSTAAAKIRGANATAENSVWADATSVPEEVVNRGQGVRAYQAYREALDKATEAKDAICASAEGGALNDKRIRELEAAAKAVSRAANALPQPKTEPDEDKREEAAFLQTFQSEGVAPLELDEGLPEGARNAILIDFGWEENQRVPQDVSDEKEALERSTAIWRSIYKYTKSGNMAYLMHAQKLKMRVPKDQWRVPEKRVDQVWSSRSITPDGSVYNPPQDLQQWQKEGLLKWKYNSCWIDTLLMALFKTPGTSLEQYVSKLQQVNVAYNSCTEEDARATYKALVEDIKVLQGRIRSDTPQCKLLRMWSKCLLIPGRVEMEWDSITEQAREKGVPTPTLQEWKGWTLEQKNQFVRDNKLVAGGFHSLWEDGMQPLARFLSGSSGDDFDEKGPIYPMSSAKTFIEGDYSIPGEALVVFHEQPISPQEPTSTQRPPIEAYSDGKFVLHAVIIRTSPRGSHYVCLVRDHRQEDAWMFYDGKGPRNQGVYRRALPEELGLTENTGPLDVFRDTGKWNWNVEAYVYLRKDDAALRLLRTLQGETNVVQVFRDNEGNEEAREAFQRDFEAMQETEGSEVVLQGLQRMAQQLRTEAQGEQQAAIKMQMQRLLLYGRQYKNLEGGLKQALQRILPADEE